jgi:chromosome segregation ATPase
VLDVVLFASLAAAAGDSGPNIPWLTIAGVVVTLVVGLGGGYFVSHRVNSGRIDTSDAATLWKESTEIRQELRNEVDSLRDRVGQAEGKIDLLNTQNEALRDRHAECLKTEAELRRQLEALESRMARARKTAPPRKRA